MIKNLDAALIRSEYKVRVYSEYLLGSWRFLFSVHELTKCQLSELESLSHSYLKRFLGLPRRASWALVHDVHGMDIKSIDHMFKESRSLTLSRIRF